MFIFCRNVRWKVGLWVVLRGLDERTEKSISEVSYIMKSRK
jgi:hypothetical protein